MAVVFISPKKQQRIFIMGIGVTVALVVAVIITFSLLSGPSQQSLSAQYNKPKVTLNFTIFTQPEFKNLTYFNKIPLQFDYTAQDASGNTVSGVISADSEADARKALVGSGLQVGKLVEVAGGRDNPFTPY